MFYELGKKFFHLFIDFLRFLQVALIFLAFLIIFYWLLQLGNITFIEPVAPFFETIKEIIHVFYKRRVEIDGVIIDFSFLLATFFVLFFSWSLKFVISGVEVIENKYDYIYEFFKKKAESLFNVRLEKEYLIAESKYNNFLILIRFIAINLSKDSFYDKDVNVGVEEKQKEILNTFYNMLEPSLGCKKNLMEESVLLYFDSFNTVDEKLCWIENIISNLKKKYREEKWLVETLVSIETYSETKDINDKISNLIILNNLGMKDKILCLASFKQRYMLIKKPMYSIIAQGVYKIKLNEEVFRLKILR